MPGQSDVEDLAAYTPGQHYAMAEELIKEAHAVGAKIRRLNEERKQFADSGEPPMEEFVTLTRKMDEQGKKAMGIYAEAQVHATLAITAYDYPAAGFR